MTPEHPAGGSAGRPLTPMADVDVAASAGAHHGASAGGAGGSAAAGGTGTTAGGAVVGGEILQPLGANEIQETFQSMSSYGMRMWSYTNDGVSVVRRFFSTSLGPLPAPSKGKGGRKKKTTKTEMKRRRRCAESARSRPAPRLLPAHPGRGCGPSPRTCAAKKRRDITAWSRDLLAV